MTQDTRKVIAERVTLTMVKVSPSAKGKKTIVASFDMAFEETVWASLGQMWNIATLRLSLEDAQADAYAKLMDKKPRQEPLDLGAPVFNGNGSESPPVATLGDMPQSDLDTGPDGTEEGDDQPPAEPPEEPMSAPDGLDVPGQPESLGDSTTHPMEANLSDFNDHGFPGETFAEFEARVAQFDQAGAAARVEAKRAERVEAQSQIEAGTSMVAPRRHGRR